MNKYNKAILILVIVLFQFIKISSKKEEQKPREVRNVLVFCFPGAKSHHFAYKELFEYTLRKASEEGHMKHIDYKFYLLVHNVDKSLWKEYDTPDHPNFKIFGFGEVAKYEEKFSVAVESAKADPVLGYQEFNKAMIHLYHDFLKDGVLELLREYKFEMIISDITNFLSVFLMKELQITKKYYVSPPCLFTMTNENFEYNPSYHPLLGTSYSEKMTFLERFSNNFFLWGTRLMYKYFAYVQNAAFYEHGFSHKLDPFVKDAFYLFQCAYGIHYAYSLPPNIMFSGPFMTKPAKPLQDEKLIAFLNIYKKNIYVSQGTIVKALRLEILADVFKHFHHFGFVLSIKSGSFSEAEMQHMIDLKNVIIYDWVPQNDLLGDERIIGFLTHGGVNSYYESIYHGKPMVLFGTNIDQINGASNINYRKLGIGITKDSEVNVKNIISYLDAILYDPIYKENCIIASKLLKTQDGRETFYYWINYIFDIGYEHLLIPSYSHYSYIEQYNVDVMIVWLIILFLILKFLIYVLKKLIFKITGKKFN